VHILFAAALALFAGGDLHYRWIGPAVMGGRLDAVAGVPGNPNLIYLGHASGGLWKSQDGGLTFSSVFEAGESSAIGAIAIDPRDPSHVVIGTGEGFPRNTADYGDGVWATHDGGTHWVRLGLGDSGSIARIAFDPADSHVILVAALGHEYAPSDERGIYRSSDGGKHWTRVLFVNATTGGSDIAFDPKHRGVVYAGTFDFLRRPWALRSGGPGSGLYKSSDGGRTWRRLTDPSLHNGLPNGPINRVGVSVCNGNPNVVYAFVPVKNGLLYRSLDGGAHWQLRNAEQQTDFRPFYFSQVRCDPSDPDRVYSMAGALLVSTDGGRKFHDIGGGGDNHDLWIDPLNPSRLLNGSDMGFNISVDRGRTWNYDDVVPFAQVYRAGYDMDTPYHVMGGLQDHEVWRGPNALESPYEDGPGNGDWLNVADWSDGQYAMADPRDPAIIYEDGHFGDLAREDLRTGNRRYISPQPLIGFGTGAGTYPYRFNWSAPLLISHFDPDAMYFGGNVLFRSNDQGNSWAAMSPDLTQCSPRQLGRSGGPITFDNTNAESYCTIYTIAEDAADPKTIWFGTDNGHLEVTRDGGTTWRDVARNLPGLPLPAEFSCIAASASTPGTAYASADRHMWDDYAPYAYVTHDYGAHWQRISQGLDSYVHVVREDPRARDVLYAGTERGLFVSVDGGARWIDFRLGLPHLPIYDLQVHPRDNDLIVASHARGFYVFDDLTPIQMWGRAHGRQAYLFAPMPALRYRANVHRENGRGAFVSENKPYGALFTLYLQRAPQPSKPKMKPSVHVRIVDELRGEIAAFDAPVHAGWNRFTWDLTTELPAAAPRAQDTRPYYIFYPMSITGPQALPGNYEAYVDVGGTQLRAPVTVRLDPHSTATTQDLTAQFAALQSLAVTQAVVENDIALLSKMRGACGVKAKPLLAQLRNTSDPSGYRAPAELSEQIAYLRYIVGQSDSGPTQAQGRLMLRYSALASSLDADTKELCR
jgi:photosystem II stability/assembly factor-like uncharacterized protein